MSARRTPARRGGHALVLPPLDRGLLGVTLGLLAFGLVMVGSASLATADHAFGDPFHYLFRDLLALALALPAGALAYGVPPQRWQRHGTLLLFLGIGGLVLVLVPGLGHGANGATRWIRLGPLNLQASEFMKLFAVIYVSDYLVRRKEEVTHYLSGFLNPLLLVSLACALIMAQPDFGTTAVILATVLGLLFLGGAPLWQFAALLGLTLGALAALVLTADYRLRRITAFVDPWEHVYGAGYQLTQALIAFGRGHWTGVGLGNGIQKQFYLPEAHTDFIMAVIGEEFGLPGSAAVILAFAFITWKAFAIARRARARDQEFSAYLAQGIGLWLGLQGFVNMGVNMGLLPTKGLTLPFLSYGSNSLIMACMAMGILLRIDHEQRVAGPGSGGERGPWAR